MPRRWLRKKISLRAFRFVVCCVNFCFHPITKFVMSDCEARVCIEFELESFWSR